MSVQFHLINAPYKLWNDKIIINKLSYKKTYMCIPNINNIMII